MQGGKIIYIYKVLIINWLQQYIITNYGKKSLHYKLKILLLLYKIIARKIWRCIFMRIYGVPPYKYAEILA